MLDSNTFNPSFNEYDVEIVTTRGSGSGGQARNKIENCVVATHRPTGISVRVDSRSQYQNKQLAYKLISAKLLELDKIQFENQQNDSRRNQIGTGMRGDKIRTYREKDDLVIDHRTNKKSSLDQWIRGNW